MKSDLDAISVFLVIAVTSCQPQLPVEQTQEIIQTKIGMDMVRIPAGTFEMGSRSGGEDEQPVHTVSLDAFYMDRFEMTQECYAKLVVANGSHFKGLDLPVEQISWADAALFCNMRSRDEGLEPCYDEATAECNFDANGYRLPTEAEWEYACRAGTTTAYSFGDDKRLLAKHGWFTDNAAKKTHPAGQKKANPWGFHDMHGNVAEWCNDPYDKSYYTSSPEQNPRGPEESKQYVLRGGGWALSADACRSPGRAGESPGFQDSCFARDIIGFRCVRNAD